MKICPLTSRPIADREDLGNDYLFEAGCLEGDCAWWLDDKDKCSIRVMAEAIDNIDEQGVNVFTKD